MPIWVNEKKLNKCLINIKRLFNFAAEINKMEFNDKQLQIIEAAEKLFADRGFKGTSVRDIAEEAGINVAMISYYFGSKVKLMEAIFEVRIGTVQMRLENLLKDDSLTPLQKINMLIDEHVDRVSQRECFFKIMITEQLINKNPAVIQAVNQLKMRNAELVGQLIKDGQKKGVFKKKVDLILMLNTLVGTVWQTMLFKDYYRSFYNLQSVSDKEFITLLKRRISVHIKTLFKELLTNEA
jgi:AcrR family transcriptional regulator